MKAEATMYTANFSPASIITGIAMIDNVRNYQGAGLGVTAYQKQKLRKGFKRRAAIEPKIGHLKQDHRLSRNFYTGIKGDNINVMLAAAAMNFKRMRNKWKENPLIFFIASFTNLFLSQ